MTAARRLLLLAAALCFAIALLLELAVFTGSNAAAWQTGGLLAVALALAARS